MSLVVHINSWPGAGKFTVARLVARETGYKLIDNHTLLNPANALFDRADPLHASLRREIRDSFFRHAAQSHAASLIFTDALADDPSDRVMFNQCSALAASRGSTLVTIVLDCELGEYVRRIVEPGRSELRKLTRPDVLADMRAKYQLLRSDESNRLDLDVTNLTASDAAAIIVSHLRKLA